MLTVPKQLDRRFWPKVVLRPNGGCWTWNGARDQTGYGRFQVQGQSRVAHRIAYEMLVGPIGDGLTLDHLCRNRACVRPDHLDPVSHRINILRGESPTAVSYRTGMCLRGLHAMDESNAIVEGHLKRCRKCDRVRRADYRRTNRDRVNARNRLNYALRREGIR